MRTVIIGNSGSGKSTLASRLASSHRLALLELDTIVWEPHQVAVPRPVAAVHAELRTFITSHERWVVEGCDGDLAELALPFCTELIFLNPGLQVCRERNQRRPWEPHKYDRAEDQQRMLPSLLAWIEDYYTRTDPRSYAFHRRLFDAYQGLKQELVLPTPP
jgi:adenylate kinase family enzyme